jgi:hypothetical protein
MVNKVEHGLRSYQGLCLSNTGGVYGVKVTPSKGDGGGHTKALSYALGYIDYTGYRHIHGCVFRGWSGSYSTGKYGYSRNP